MKLLGILALILTVVLWYLYHKCFTVVYTNALAGIIREIAVCFVLSVVIVGTICSVLGIDPKSNRTEADESSLSTQGQHNWQEASVTQERPITQELPIMGFYGDFYNIAVLNGSIFNVTLSMEESESFLHILGRSYAMGLAWEQNIDVIIPMPEGNSFVCNDELNGISLTITLHPEDHSLEIVQQPTNTNFGTPYTGSYIDRLTSVSMSPELNGAMDAIDTAWWSVKDLVIKSEPTPEGDYDYYGSMNSYILEGNGVKYRCDSTENGGSISITLVRNEAHSARQCFYASIYAYDFNGELSRIIEGYLTTMADDSLGLYSDSGYLGITLKEGYIEVVEYCQRQPENVDFRRNEM